MSTAVIGKNRRKCQLDTQRKKKGKTAALRAVTQIGDVHVDSERRTKIKREKRNKKNYRFFKGFLSFSFFVALVVVRATVRFVRPKERRGEREHVFTSQLPFSMTNNGPGNW